MALNSPCGILDIPTPRYSVRCLSASFTGPLSRPRGVAEPPALQPPTPPGITSAYRKVLNGEMVTQLTNSRHKSVTYQFIAWFNCNGASPVNRQSRIFDPHQMGTEPIGHSNT